ncbi:MAG: NAD+ synthase [Pseudomonadales bacterium]|nr:NAD+ synthase [Pseudomonadales bacterium]
MQQTWCLALAQINPLVGDIEGNLALIIKAADEALARGADLVVYPELALIGYPPEDLLLRPALEARIQGALHTLQASTPLPLVLGYPGVREGHRYNLAGFIVPGRAIQEYRKRCLPNYQVFDERRYFEPGHDDVVIEHAGVKIGLLLCEDIWHEAIVQSTVKAGAELLVCLNASPYHLGKQQQRLNIVRQHQSGCPLVYVNMVGGQDELVFDGASFILDGAGQQVALAPDFQEIIQLHRFTGAHPEQVKIEKVQDEDAELYAALVMGVRDYVQKNRFPGVVLGLSGGIDSALTLCIAVDALGPDKVTAVMMPYRYTAPMSEEDAAEQARRLGVVYHGLSIEPIVASFIDVLQPLLAGKAPSTTLENLQARARGVLLMALSNQSGALVLTTGNKSEMAVGYATLYGDMAGGFDVLKDVPKTRVFRLAQWLNQRDPGKAPIPQRVIDRPPSAELAPDQKDEDSLPPYDLLDAMLKRYIEEDASAHDLLREGYKPEDVHRVLRMVDRNEYKRRQAAIGPRVTERGFGKDRRYPVTQGWQQGG